jgi:hypothetical protein
VPAGPTLAELLAPWSDATFPVLTRTTRMERALVSLATHTSELRKRVETMEQRVDGRELMTSSAPTRADIEEIREQSTRLAHDLARLSIDLREELAKAVDAVRLAQTHGNAIGGGNGNGHAEDGNGHVAYPDIAPDITSDTAPDIAPDTAPVEPAEMIIDLTEVRHTYP